MTSVQKIPGRAGKRTGHRANSRAGLLTDPSFRRYFSGYTTSVFGSSMSQIATNFAVLDSVSGPPARRATELGYVAAAQIVPILLFLLGGGVLADRLGPRRVMIAADWLRCAAQLTFVAALVLGRPQLWEFVAIVAARGVGEGLALPCLQALIPQLAPPHRLSDANALLATARSSANVAGPALAGLLVAGVGPAVVLAVDAATFAVSAVALLGLRIGAAPSSAGADQATDKRSAIRDLREGWTQFRSRSWLWITTLQFTLFNLLVWAPFLVLGPAIAQQRLGGAGAWGLVMALYGAGAACGGVLMLGRKPRRPLAVATLAAFGWALPSAALGFGTATWCVDGAALLAGVGSSVAGTLYNTTDQQYLPPDVLGRVTSYTVLGAFGLGPIGLAAAGPIAAAVGSANVLRFGALWQIAATCAVLAIPVIRRLPPGSGQQRGEGQFGGADQGGSGQGCGHDGDGRGPLEE